ncbi:MAG: 2-dehydro-3-deoxy-D-gluconate 5-dehydrogenase KduD [Bacteroidota bacterium]
MELNQLFSLNGSTAIVTGASTGLGQSMAVALAAAGANCVLVARRDSTETAKKIAEVGREAVVIAADISEKASINKIMDAAIGSFGKVDILVNNAGIIRRAAAIDFSEKDWDEVLSVNAKSVFFLSQAAAKDMMKRKQGKIINIASLLSFQGGITVPSYAASKGAVAQLTKALANEWAHFGINVNAIAPGYMSTDNTAPLRANQTRFQQISERIPAGRWGTPEDVQGAVVFLASKASDYVNGHVLVVDGGWMAR